MTINEALSYVVPVVSVLTTYIIGRLQNLHNIKYNVAKERYEKFYIPYIKLLYTQDVFSGVLSSNRPRASIIQEFDLIMDNIQYLGQGSLSRVHYLCDAISNILKSHKDSELEEAAQLYDYESYNFRKKVLTEASELSEILHLPNVGKQLLTLFCNTQIDFNKIIESDVAR